MTMSGSDITGLLGTAIVVGGVVHVVDSTMGKGSRRRTVKSPPKPRPKSKRKATVKRTTKSKRSKRINLMTVGL